MRILQVTPYWAPAWAYGGPPRVMHRFATGLAARGHEVVVYTTDVLDDGRRSRPARETVEGVEVHRFRNLSNGLAWRRKKYLPPGLVAATLRDARAFDILHVTDARTVPTAAAFLGTLVGRTPLCVSAHGSLPASVGVRGAVKRVYDAALVRPMLRRAALLLAQTAHEASLYRVFGGTEAATHLLPLPLPPVDPPGASGAFRRRIGLEPGVRMLLFLGRLSPLKGVDLLIEACAPLLGAHAVLVLVGRDDGHLGALQARFAELFADGRVRFVGPAYGADRFAAYADADVFCLTPTHWEETSVAALEAAACGAAIVVTEQADMPGLAEGGAGWVVPAAPGAIREAVRRALADEGAGARAQRHVLASHDPERVVDRLERLMIDARRGPRP